MNRINIGMEAQNMAERQVITIKQLAAELDVNVITVKRMVQRNELPPYDFNTGLRGIKGWHVLTLQKTLCNSRKVPG